MPTPSRTSPTWFIFIVVTPTALLLTFNKTLICPFTDLAVTVRRNVRCPVKLTDKFVRRESQGTSS